MIYNYKPVKEAGVYEVERENFIFLKDILGEIEDGINYVYVHIFVYDLDKEKYLCWVKKEECRQKFKNIFKKSGWETKYLNLEEIYDIINMSKKIL